MDASQIVRAQFAARLHETLTKAHCPAYSATTIANEFNLRWYGPGISPACIETWLTGKAFPRLEKMRILADWLGVSAGWLCFGDEQSASATSSQQFDPADLQFFSDIKRLSPDGQRIILEFTRALMRLERERGN